MFRARVYKVLAVTVFWAVMAFLQVLYDDLVYSGLGANVAPYSFARSALLNPLAALVGGPIGAGIVILFIKERLRRLPFWQVVLAQSLTYITFILILSYAGSLLYLALEGGRPLLGPVNVAETNAWFFGPLTLRNLLFWTVVASMTSFMVEVFDVIPGSVKNFAMGRYHRPRLEDRTFMFLDLAGSTTIAERLGPKGYHRFLNEYFSDLAAPILASRGEIYQYVGDEVIVTWPDRVGLEKARCISCFFGIKDKVAERTADYVRRFGVEPTFRASFHYGEVTVGEVGLAARDIVFTGDVLNTAARIQERCKTHDVEALASEDLVKALGGIEAVAFQPVETVALRGKASSTTIYALARGG